MTIARKKISPAAGSLSTHNGFSLISNEKLLELYATMLKCQMLDDSLGARVKNNGSRPRIEATSGNVAAIAGVAIDLRPDDTLAPSPGGLGSCYVKGLPLAAIFATASGRNFPASYASFNLIPPRLRFPIQLHRTLVAAAAGNGGRNRKVAAIFCSESTPSNELEGALIRARNKKLPIVFVCHFGVDQGGGATRVEGRGYPEVIVDANDAVAIYRVATEAIAHARRGSGPTLIECRPWPVTGIEGRKRHSARDPIRNMELYLARKGLSARRIKSQLMAEFLRELDNVAQTEIRSLGLKRVDVG